MAKSDGGDYFRRTSLFWIVAVTFGMGYFTCIVFAPEKIPFQLLGPFGSFCTYLVDNHADIMYKGWWAASGLYFMSSRLFPWCMSEGVCVTGERSDVGQERGVTMSSAYELKSINLS
ncbi:transmembrane protein 254 [Lates japonicus]|uniref:Transmembrane protein 254 n=1 Tax=Lates japonicus TaxID=270547 RepID=A0AAD3NCV2_LATJO|nr:transmembrane protein 254 [Lates japonicus]